MRRIKDPILVGIFCMVCTFLMYLFFVQNDVVIRESRLMQLLFFLWCAINIFGVSYLLWLTIQNVKNRRKNL
jgi:hypothetical protein